MTVINDLTMALLADEVGAPSRTLSSYLRHLEVSSGNLLASVEGVNVFDPLDTLDGLRQDISVV